ncbi:K+ transport flavoprotein [Corynebacterium deserti GIMN1.010]|uniref:K+ transport flavoprotein n=1 Tax=Corynebacterium deserti GIMN1.010 TaxID=931089 RepID=A0A0M4CZV7_9CORY|nr:NAD(P)-binding domain-containing protein [Corynebacterium deserti]ALC06845.1 K+ transport flavoprotein [Corynebacterium deserti GIMN1.010]
MSTNYGVIIIGAGQAGLAAAHELVRRGFTPGTDFLVLDSNDGPGGAWRHRWDSLTLGKAHGIADLPGLPMDRPDPKTPASTLVTQYYGSYEEKFDLAVVRPVKVTRVEPVSGKPVAEDPTSPLRVTSDDGREWITTMILNATGTWTNPYVPYIPGIDKFQGKQLHTVDYRKAADFDGKKVLVVGGGLSAVQFLLELEGLADTVWATRRPPNFTQRQFDDGWGLAVEKAVRERTYAGIAPASVVRTTGIPQWPDYLEGVKRGLIVSHGMFDEITPTGVVFAEASTSNSEGLGPSAGKKLAVPESWAPYPAGTEIDVDVIFWNTGFRAALRHLAPMKLRGQGRGIELINEVSPASDSRILLVGYGSTASTVGATRAGRIAGRVAAKRLRA